MYAQKTGSVWNEIPPGSAITLPDGSLIAYSAMSIWTNAQREAKGIYLIVDDEIPDNKVVVSSYLVEVNKKPFRMWNLVDKPAAPFKVYKADFWRRTTDVEAEILNAMLNEAPIKQQMIFRDCLYISSDDELFTTLHAAIESAFGETRANQLLAASVE